MNAPDLVVPVRAITDDMSAIGRIGMLGNRPSDGYLRAAYSPEETLSMEYIASRSAALGAQTRRDEAGNLRCQWPGRTDKKILLHSHLDTVVNGGNYDGVIGVVAGLVAIERVLSAYPNENDRPYTLELGVWAGEESGTYKQAYKGSLAAFGRLDPAFLFNTFEDPRTGTVKTLEAAMKSQGIDPEFVRSGQRTISVTEADNILAAIEAHIEQGEVLERAGLRIGSVTSIFGAVRTEAVFEGREDHSGTTPMAHRIDANLTGAKWTVLMDDYRQRFERTHGVEIRQNFGQIKGGVGYSSVSAMASVRWEVRAGSDAILEAYLKGAEALTNEIESESQVKIRLRREGRTSPIERLSDRVQRAVLYGSQKAGQEPLAMISGAGHDTAVLAEELSAGMFFIQGGRSHSPQEYCSSNDIALASTVMAYGVGHLFSLS